jgi:hypothetical protein|tara:strand:- start:6298 stop:6636 length:339 start_codon:yes stop_codon:yes gene_type:complete
MGKSQRDKGARIERKVVALLTSVGILSERVPLSGAAGGSFSGDIKMTMPLMPHTKIIEVKGRNTKGVYWRTAEKHLGNNDYLFMWEDRVNEPLVVMSFNQFTKLVKNDHEDF